MRKYPDYKYKPRRKPKNITYTPASNTFHTFNPFSTTLLNNGAALTDSNLLQLQSESYNHQNYSSIGSNSINQPSVAAALATINSTNQANLVNKPRFLLTDYYEQFQQQMQRQQNDLSNIDYNLLKYPMFNQQNQQRLPNISMLCNNMVANTSTSTINSANTIKSHQLNQQDHNQPANLSDPVSSLFYTMQQQFAGNLLNLANSTQLTNLTNKFTIDNLINCESKEIKQTELPENFENSKEERKLVEDKNDLKDQEIENYENKSLNDNYVR